MQSGVYYRLIVFLFGCLITYNFGQYPKFIANYTKRLNKMCAAFTKKKKSICSRTITKEQANLFWLVEKVELLVKQKV